MLRTRSDRRPCRRPAVAARSPINAARSPCSWLRRRWLHLGGHAQHGFTAERMTELVRDGFVTKTEERVVGSEEPFDIARFKLAGQHALGD
jgi:hypothetical protein